MAMGREKRIIVLLSLGLILATLIAYEPVRQNDFVGYDDGVYIFENPRVAEGLSLSSIAWAFTSLYGSNWHPLTWISHMLDCQLFGLDAFGHHLVNILLHIATTLLLFWVLNRMTRAKWASAFVAGLFALHPLHVESVAWAAERKDVLCAFFWMLTIVFYFQYVQKPGTRRYLFVAVSFLLGLLSKPMIVTLPFVLLLLDFWPLCRIRWTGKKEDNSKGRSSNANLPALSPGRLFVEKVPLFVLIILSSSVTFIAQQSETAMASLEGVPLKWRITNAAVSYLQYIVKMINPTRLAVLYPHPLGTLPMWLVIFCALLLVGITAGVLYWAKTRRYLAVGWLWYVGTLVPVIGLVQVGNQAMADRYTYLPLVGIFIMIAWGGAELFQRWPYRKVAGAIFASLLFVAMAAATRAQVKIWKDSATLYKHALKVTENNYVLHYNYGLVFFNQGRFDEAEEHFRETLRLQPGEHAARNNLGSTLYSQGKLDEAVTCFQEILRARAVWPEAHHNLGLAYYKLGKDDLALQHYGAAIDQRPEYGDAISNLGSLLKRQGKTEEAMVKWNKALAVDPYHPDAHFNLGMTLLERGNREKALFHFSEALTMRPRWPDVHYMLGNLHLFQGKLDLSAYHFEEALRANPGDLKSGISLANICFQQKRVGEAVERLKAILRAHPDQLDVLNNLAVILAITDNPAIRNPGEAIRLAKKGCEMTNNKKPGILDTLGMAYAAAGKFKLAVQAAEKALALAEKEGESQRAGEIRKRLSNYRVGKR